MATVACLLPAVILATVEAMNVSICLLSKLCSATNLQTRRCPVPRACTDRGHGKNKLALGS